MPRATPSPASSSGLTGGSGGGEYGSSGVRKSASPALVQNLISNRVESDPPVKPEDDAE